MYDTQNNEKRPKTKVMCFELFLKCSVCKDGSVLNTFNDLDCANGSKTFSG